MKIHYLAVSLFLLFGLSFPLFSQFKPSSILDILQEVADYQVKTPLTHTETDWTNGALYTGMVSYAGIAKDDRYYNWLKEIGYRNGWTYLHRTDPLGKYHADDYCVGQMYLEMYRKFGKKEMLEPMRAYLDEIMSNPSSVDLEFVFTDTYWATERWSWCDALFMGPTVWAKMAAITGDQRYLDFMVKEYKATTDYLYDKEEHLFYRDSRFIGQREANGAKIFWGRGNGWVFAGLPIIISELPDDYAHKEYFINLYREMAAKIVSLQDENGYWHASLLDPASYPNPEMSATGFFVYGLAWGVRNNYLDRTGYMPAVTRGWKAMTEAVWPDGKVGWIQPIGYDPKHVTREMTEVYGTGAFLLAGVEVYRLLLKHKEKN